MQPYREIKKATAEIVNVRVVRITNTENAHAAIRDLIVSNPSISYAEMAAMLGCSRWLIYTVAAEFDVRRPRESGSPARRRLKSKKESNQE